MTKAPRMVANGTDTRPPKNRRTIVPMSPRRTDDPLYSRSDCIFLPLRHEEERQNQSQLQCKNGKAAHNRHPVAPANGEPSQPCQPQDVCGNVTHDACKEG